MATPADDDAAALFARAYRDMVDNWPVPVTSLGLATRYGKTHALACGDPGGPAALLLPGGGATATAWRAIAAGLSGSHRVVAVDPIGQPGLSTRGGRRVAIADDLDDWLDQVLDSLSVPHAALFGHSYGAWMALRYTLHAPGRVSRLVLLDPTDCFAPLSLRYRLRALPLLARPSGQRMRHFLAWETQGRPLDSAWLTVISAGQNLGRMNVILPKRPRRRQLATLHVPVMVIVAARSRAHDPCQITRRAHAWLPDVTTATLPHATHHSLPADDARETLGLVQPFLAGQG